MAFRLLDQLPQYRSALGVILDGGTLNFYVTGTSTPKNVYAEPALSTNLGSTITLDSDGRHSEDVWLAEDAEYRVVLKDSAGVTVWTRDRVRALDQTVAADFPDAADGNDGDVLKTDGTSGGWYFEAQDAIPSQTGNSGKYLSTDGSALLWSTPETYDESSLPDGITQDATTLQVGKFKIQTGTGTIPVNASGVTASVAITFAEAFTTLLHVSVTCSGGSGSTPQGLTPALRVVGSGSGATVYAYAGDEHDDPPGWYLTSTTPFTYVAFGIVA